MKPEDSTMKTTTEQTVAQWAGVCKPKVKGSKNLEAWP